jgi:phosphoglycolate phosphatase
MRYRVIVWDFDGTLADTLTLALATYNDLAAQYGCLPVEDAAAVRSMATRTFLRQHRISWWRLPRLVRAYHAATKDRMATIRLFDGVPEVLRSLKASGCRQGVLSSNSADNVRACLSASGVEEVFDFIVGYPRLFGKARVIRRLVKSEAVQPQDFLYIGDEVRDMEAATKAGVDSAAVCWGIHGAELLSQQTPTFIWSSVTEVLPALLGSEW